MREQEIHHPPALPLRAQDPTQCRLAADIPPIAAFAIPNLDERTFPIDIGDPKHAHPSDAHAGPQHGHEEGAVAQLLNARHQGAGLVRSEPAHGLDTDAFGAQAPQFGRQSPHPQPGGQSMENDVVP